MIVRIRPELKIFYPGAVFGSLLVKNQENMKRDDALEEKKRLLEKEIKEKYPNPKEDDVIQGYNDYYRKWGKTYPIEYQIKSLKKGKKFPQVSVLVDCMFMAELSNRILTSGHDKELIKGEPVFDLSDEGESYTMLNGKNQELEKNDVVLRDDEGILASVLFGPARRTSIRSNTCFPLYFAWCPQGIEPINVEKHLHDIIENLKTVFTDLRYEAHLH